MKSASESLQQVIDDCKALKIMETQESAVNSNKGFVGAEHGKRVKRDAPEHTPIDGPRIETAFGKAEGWLHGFAEVLRAHRLDRQRALAGIPVRTQSKTRRDQALKMVDASPLEVALALGYTTDRAVRTLREREGLDGATGRPLTADQRPIVSPNRKRVR